jgi:8-oxo-dGTP diphosphatase
MNSHYIENHLVKTTVGAIILNRENEEPRILLTRRGYPPFKGQWCLPGGHIDSNETARQAIIREVKEEVGLDFDAKFFRYFDEIIPEKKIHAVVLIFTGRTTGEPQTQSDEVSELRWFKFAEVRSLQLAFQHNQIITAYQKSDFSNLSRIPGR